ncbi:hypothetical protein [Curtobacterium sp. ISL-83]|uniref:hypothetical protein n=1 Tax=Curtobacterium sp. ISL-83 TaxID=2819145 RepID=UPI001BECADC9|nr:hypothetical protein [Curtobacterium sp. ISL-83]MBT2502785.1 hypothetical protein [Curtobacterium sp. ISL-83]
MTDTTTRPARPAPAEWPNRTTVRTVAELLLGLSFTAAVAFGGYSASTGQLAVLAQAAAIVFVVTATCVLVSWFHGVETAAPAER